MGKATELSAVRRLVWSGNDHESGGESMNDSLTQRSAQIRETCAADLPTSAAGQPWRALMIMCCLVMAGPGCVVTPPAQKSDPAVHPGGDIAVSFEQARLRMRALVGPLSGDIIESADRIMAGTTDPAVKRAALLWKIEAVPALREALFRPDP